MLGNAAHLTKVVRHLVARRRALASWVAAAICALTGCGDTSVDTSIEPGSQRAAIIGADGATAYTGLAILEHLQAGSGSCSAALIAPNLVLTTKHCVFR